VELLLLPHHGSETAPLATLLEAADPDGIWFSSSAVPPLAEELDRRALPWSSTGVEGPLSARFLLDPWRP
jgi:hypothetical protein